MAQKADKIFSICGPYWYDTIEQSSFAFWKPKMVRLDMAVDGNIFPFCKEKFNPVGKRRLLYMGSAMGMKNVGQIANIMSILRDTELHWYGGDGNHPLAKLPNVKTVGWVEMNKETGKKIANDCDIMINTSTSDANPTTLLEARAWGLVTACSRESGYYNDQYFTNISATDPKEAVRQLMPLLNAPSEVLMERAKDSRKEIETRYSWDVFCNKIWQGLQELA
jgi:glycosyltransferase involved in cell wall biosynthesis